MPAAIAITWKTHTPAQLRRASARSEDADAARRMLALAHVLEGKSREEAAASCGMDRQTLRDWVHRYNAEGLEGLTDRVAPGAKPRLSSDQQRELAELVRRGPSLAEHGVVRWRRADLGRVIAEQFGVKLAERSVGDLLRRLGFRRLSVRPRSPHGNAVAQEAHKKTSPTWLLPVSRSTLAASRSSSGGKTKPASASKAR